MFVKARRQTQWATKSWLVGRMKIGELELEPTNAHWLSMQRNGPDQNEWADLGRAASDQTAVELLLSLETKGRNLARS